MAKLYKEIKIEDNVTLYAINIEKIDDRLKKYIDNKLISICKGRRDTKLEVVKKEFIKYLERKEKSNLLSGSVSEFFIHLFLNSRDFKQEFLYFNLEENSIKKGFDGYYSKSDLDWVLESKSTTDRTKKHKEIINKAYSGLKDKIEGKDNKNNPWENAYHHADQGAVNSSDTILKKLNTLSQLYEEENYGKVEDFNLMTSSTIFLEKDWQNIDENELKASIQNYIKDKNFLSLIVICLNKGSMKHLMDYLKL